MRSFRLEVCLELTCDALVDLAQTLGFLERQSLLYPVVCHKEISLRERLWLFRAADLKEIVHCAISGLPRELLALI